MNHAHGTHWTAVPDPRIPHVLRGWNPDGTGPAEHRLDLGEMLVRSVPIRGAFGGPSEAYGNSIFVFKVEGLCIGHGVVRTVWSWTASWRGIGPSCWTNAVLNCPLSKDVRRAVAR